MSAMKAYAMSPQGVAEAQRAVAQAERRWDAFCAACALAQHKVDDDILCHLSFYAARELGEAHERLALAQGYGSAHDIP